MNAASTSDAARRNRERIEGERIIPFVEGKAAAVAKTDHTFSGKTLLYWGILRPDGTSVRDNPLERGPWKYDPTLTFGGYSARDDDATSYEQRTAVHAAQVLTERLTELGVPVEAAQHQVVLFRVVTRVEALPL